MLLSQVPIDWINVLGSSQITILLDSIENSLITQKGSGKNIYPKEEFIFKAFQLTPFEQVKVVILGQDPYHGEGQAHGLAFSVPDGIKIPPSLRNIFKELNTDLQKTIPISGNLTHWAEQGVLLLNNALTVEKDKPNSHAKIGWNEFTNHVIETISTKKSGVVFLLWGKFAEAKKEIIDSSKHHILISSHPSPLSAYQGFLGCKHFSKTNQLLIASNSTPIIW